ncbi:MAG: transcriptional regulator MntR [Bacillota bacterium]|nr:transcriptional regulator MntR [Bacillota bacterium]
MSKEKFHTFSEYMKKEDDTLTASMEDYLEMIYRLSEQIGFTRIHDLAKALNVQPPSATKMVQKLSEAKLIDYEKYGIIILTEAGKNKGRFLLYRHNIIEGFLRLLGISDSILEQTEKIEHTISNKTLEYFSDFINFIQENPEIISKFDSYRKEKDIKQE